MAALGLLHVAPAPPFKIAGRTDGRRIVILGAGLAGMCAAFELRKLGYDCVILEARTRAGGRCWTVRGGTEETELGGPRQVATFDGGLYLNPGPARIPQHHATVLGYCRDFGVAVEPFINVNEAAWCYTDSGPLAGRRVRLREARSDLRGYASELLAKAIRTDALDRPLTDEDRERLRDWLAREGDLAPDLAYRGSSHRGYTTLPGAAGQPGTVADPYELSALLGAGFGNWFSLDYAFTRQMTMLQIVGGTDGIAKAFEQRTGPLIRYGSEVRAIRRAGTGVRIVYRDQQGAERLALGDACICTIPLPVLARIPADWSAEMRTAIASVSYTPTVKAGLQFSVRFWEEEDRIFGGISRTTAGVTQIWYPSSGFLGAKGILVGCYNYDRDAIELGRLAPADRLARVLAEGRTLHPQYDSAFETGFSVAWQRISYTEGGWAAYTGDQRDHFYPTLNQPDGPFYLAGEHLTYLTGWMEGALQSAHRVVGLLHARFAAAP
jgi:monoamine oxidase